VFQVDSIFQTITAANQAVRKFSGSRRLAEELALSNPKRKLDASDCHQQSILTR
jgi:hypothetical protein